MKQKTNSLFLFFSHVLDCKKIGNIGNIVDYQGLTSATERQQNGNSCRLLPFLISEGVFILLFLSCCDMFIAGFSFQQSLMSISDNSGVVVISFRELEAVAEP